MARTYAVVYELDTEDVGEEEYGFVLGVFSLWRSDVAFVAANCLVRAWPIGGPSDTRCALGSTRLTLRLAFMLADCARKCFSAFAISSYQRQLTLEAIVAETVGRHGVGGGVRVRGRWNSSESLCLIYPIQESDAVAQ